MAEPSYAAILESKVAALEAQLAEALAEIEELTTAVIHCGEKHTEKWLAEVPRVTYSDQKWRDINADLEKQLAVKDKELRVALAILQRQVNVVADALRRVVT